jgi:predicted thioesterase
MKKLLSTLIPAVMIAVPLMASAQVESGYCNFGKQTVGSQVCFGHATLNGTTVTGNLVVMGVLTTKNGAHVEGKTSVFGPLFASNTQFDQQVFVATNTLTLNNSHINGNLTEKSSSQKGVINMSSGSTVSGNVDFSAQKGVVNLSGGSSIAGTVINGTEEKS